MPSCFPPSPIYRQIGFDLSADFLFYCVNSADSPLWGYLFDKQLDYAAGVFNGSRNSFESQTNNLDFVGHVNARPFQMSEELRSRSF